MLPIIAATAVPLNLPSPPARSVWGARCCRRRPSTSAMVKPPPAEGHPRCPTRFMVTGHRGDSAAGSGRPTSSARPADPADVRTPHPAAGRTAAAGRPQLPGGDDGLHPLDRVRQRDRDVVTLAHTEIGVARASRLVVDSSSPRVSVRPWWGDRGPVRFLDGQSADLGPDRRDVALGHSLDLRECGGSLGRSGVTP